MIRFVALLVGAAAVPCFASQIQLSDFVSPTVETYTGLSALFPLSCGGIPCQSTPLVIDGNTYSTSANDGFFLRYLANPGNCPGSGGACINTNSDLGFIDITLSSPMLRVGGFATTFGAALFEFFDSSNNLLGSASGGGGGFVGWEDAGGIARIRITDQEQNSTSMLFDDLTFEGPITQSVSGAPEPASYALLLSGALVIAGARFAKIRVLKRLRRA